MSENSLSDRLMATLEQVQAMDGAAAKVSTDMMDPDNNEADAFSQDLPDVKVESISSSAEDEDNSDITTDYKRSRDFTYAMQEVNLVMLKNACSMACTTAHPRAYDVVNNIMATMRGLNKDLMDFQKTFYEGKGKKRLLPAKEMPQGGGGDGGGMEATVTTDGTSLHLSIGPRPTTQNIMEVIKQAREKGIDVSKLNNQEIIELAQQADGVFGEAEDGDSESEG
ncbi:MAG: terminase small subunit [Aeromonas popoffii]|uniref:terminase small subunit n=1 Tax=Aeromonas popoffii TaxID=70856 RepID=UPI003F3BE692